MVEVEESYTQEVLAAEERAFEFATKLRQSEENVRALQAKAANNVQFDRLEHRDALEQRDQALKEASLLNDKVNQYGTSIANLQLVIQQIQKGW